MSKEVQIRRGTTAQHAEFVGKQGEVTMDTERNCLVVHDGETAGGHPVAKKSETDALTSQLAAKVNIENIEILTLQFDDWEQGDISSAGGVNIESTTTLRTADYHQFTFGKVNITPEAEYKCGVRWYTHDGETYTRVGSTTATNSVTTITVNPNYYYRFVIALVAGGGTSTAEWATHVAFSTYPLSGIRVELDQAKIEIDAVESDINAEDMISPNYEIIDLPIEILGWQGIVKVGTEIWFCDESTDVGGTLDGTIYRVSASDYSYIGTFVHNLGHMNNVSYDTANDRILLGSASNDNLAPPKIWVIESASDWVGQSSGTEFSYASLDAKEIDLSGLVATYGTLSYINACWGAPNANGTRCVYINATLGAKWLLITLGIGTDQKEYGSYVAADSGKFNGSFDLVWIKYCTINDIPGLSEAQVCQGMALWGGKIISSVTHTPITGAIFTPRSDSNVKRTIIRILWKNDDGSVAMGSNNGMMIDNGLVYFGIDMANKLAKISL
jgi:hypothetical protein